MHPQGLRWFATLGALAAGALVFAGVASAKNVPLTSKGTVVVRALPTARGTTLWSPDNEFVADREAEREAAASGSRRHAGNARTTIPTPSPNPVAGADSALGASWQGLNHFDNRYANGGNQFSLEPPDQGLCAGGTYVVETVNTVFRVYSTVGGPLTGVIDLNTFFGLPASIDRTTGIDGPFLSDPKCYFDTDTQRWFLTVLEEDPLPSVRAATLIAVSQTSDPTGAWYRYAIDATDDGDASTPAHPGCPCFGDQPLIGADAYGFYVSTNEYQDETLDFNGAQVYAMSKSKLEAGDATGTVVQFESPPLVEGPGYSIQPATSPSASDYDRSNGGTEHFLSSLDFNGTYDHRIAAWAITNTSSLNSSSPSLSLKQTVMKSEVYTQPQPADQKSGPHPFGEWGANFYYGGPLDQPLETLNTNDDRMNQVVYAGRTLYGAVNTAVLQNGTVRAGVAWFKVAPNVTPGGVLVAHIVGQGYYAPAGANVLFPSIGVTPGGGKAVIAFSLSGPDYYPSQAYATLGSSTIHIAAAGVGPEDGFTGYDPFADDGVARWGDYSAAVANGGTIWIANEYIAQSCTLAQYQADQTCGGTRSPLANWSTRVSAINP
jgi:hypothetical protein